MDKIKDWLKAVEDAPLTIRKLLQSKHLAEDALDATIAYVLGKELTEADKAVFIHKVVPLLQGIDPTFTVPLTSRKTQTMGPFAELDQRSLQYRFDLEQDIPWGIPLQGGRFFSAEYLRAFGINLDPALSNLRQDLEWCWGLTICRAFDYFEKDIIQKLGDPSHRIRSTQSSHWLIEEEVKHRKLFRRLGKKFEELAPDRLELFNRCYQPPVCYEIPYEDRKDLEKIEQHQYIIWLYTLFFEDFTVYLHEMLRHAEVPIQATWLVAHAKHRQEEEEHLRTDHAYLELCGLNQVQMRSLSKEFFLAFQHNYLDFFGLGTCQRYMQALHPEQGHALFPVQSWQDLPFFQDLLHHPLFEGTRSWAPILKDLRNLPRRDQTANEDREIHLILALEETVRKFPRHGIHTQNISGDWELLTYQDLYERAKEMAAALHEVLDQNTFVLIFFPDVYHNILCFWASLFAGRTPIILAHSTRLTAGSEEWKRLHSMAGCLPSPAFLTDIAGGQELRALLVDKTYPVFVIDELQVDGIQEAVYREGGGDTVAFLQFSSGSTGDPKGIILSHKNIMANALQMILARQGRHSDRFLNWMPLHHDMGFIGFHITPLILGADQYHILPFQFMRHPALWPSLVSQHRITHAGTTNTALKTLLRWGRAKQRDAYDLSSLNSLIIGAEPVEKQTLAGLMEVFAGSGLQKTCLTPAFGMAEAALGVSFLPHHQSFATLCVDRGSLKPGGQIKVLAAENSAGVELVSLGQAVMDLTLRIVDEDGRVLPEGFVGYLAIQGPNVSRAFWGLGGYHPQLDAEGWYRTQDIAFVQGKELFALGRLQELFFSSGKNYFLNDVDSVVEQLSEVRPGGCAAIVCSASGQQAADVVVFVDLLQPPGQALEPLLEKVHKHIRQNVGISVGKVVALSRRQFVKTTSGKIKRWEMERNWSSGVWHDAASYGLLEAPRQTSNLDIAVARLWSEVLETTIHSGQWDTPFLELGGTSLKAIRIHDGLEFLVGKPLDPSWILSLDTIRKQAVAALGMKSGVERTADAIGVMKSNPVASMHGGMEANSSALDGAKTTRAASDGDERIAIVGIGLRYPGAQKLDEFARLIVDGKQNFAPLSDSRCRQVGIDPDRTPPTERPYGSFLESIDQFDAQLFQLSTRQAQEMDPQHRILLEIAHDCLAQSRIISAQVGIFVASGDNEYADLVRLHAGLNEESLIGSLSNMVAAQISRAFALHGPALKIDTACSSSLYAVHLACQSLRHRECDAALAGGVQINLTAKGFEYFKSAGLIKRDEPPAPFADAGSGLVPGEGGGLVLLKRYQDAIRDRDFIYAVIAGSGVNNDGPSLRGTAPNPNGQSQLLQRVYSAVPDGFDAVDYFEAHAAGTAIGDSIEVQALQTAYNALQGDQTKKIALGSAKAIFGHTLSAAGITSLLKVIASLDRGIMPSTLVGRPLTPRIDFANGNFQPLLTPLAWPTRSRPRRAGINSLGLGGTNVHVIVEDPPVPAVSPKTPAPLPFIISVGGASPEHFAQRSQSLRKISAPVQAELRESILVGSCLSDQFALHRRLYWTADRDEGEAPAKIFKERPLLAFVYPGPGCQYTGMGKFLYDAVPIFRQTLDDCHRRLSNLGFDLLATMFDERQTRSLMQIESSQPVVFAFSYAMSRLLEELDVRPDFVLGHSAGEYAAAVEAGMMDLDSALACVLQRGRLMAQAPKGAMAVVAAAEDDLRRFLQKEKLALHIAAINAPNQCSISGDEASIIDAVKKLERDGYQATQLDVSCAAHSPAMGEAARQLQDFMQPFSWKKAQIPVISTVHSQILDQVSPAYWSQQLVQPVLFARGVEQALKLGAEIFLEVSPTSGLVHCIQAMQAAQRSLKLSLLRRGQDNFDHTLTSLNELYKRGFNLRLEHWVAHTPKRDRVQPEFRRRSFWPRISLETPDPVGGDQVHTLSPEDRRLLDAHRIQGRASAPFGFLMDLLAQSNGKGSDFAVRDLIFLNSLFADTARTVRVQTAGDELEMMSDQTFLAQARRVPHATQVFQALDLKSIQARCHAEIDPLMIYNRRRSSGLEIAPSLQALARIQKGDRELLVTLEAAADAHPGVLVQAALVDAAMQATSALFSAEDQSELYLGFGIEYWQLFKPLRGEALVYIGWNDQESVDDMLKFDLIFADREGTIFSQMHNFSVKRLKNTTPVKAVESVKDESLEHKIFHIFSKHLHCSIGANDENELFNAFGVDSLKAVRIANEIQDVCKIKLPATLLFETPNLKALIRELKRRLA